MSRGIWRTIGARTRRSLVLLWVALFVFSIGLQYLQFAAPASVLAVHDEGLFELDGNVGGSAEAGDDWNPVYNDASSAFETTFVDDPINGAPDKWFTGGDTTKDIADISSWLWTDDSGQPQDKNDISHAYAAAYEDDGDLIVYFGLDRYASNGAAQVGFWFVQAAVGLGPEPNFIGSHSVGDVLVQIDFENGGASPQMRIYEWVETGGDTSGTLELLASGGSCATAAAGDTRCAIASTGSTDPAWPFDDKGTAGSSNDIPAGGFVEGGINLTALGLDDGCFASFIAETRSSPSETSTLSDFALGQFSLCAPPVIATQVQQNGVSLGSNGSINVGETVTDTATLSGSKGPVTGTVDFFVCGPSVGVPNCATGGTPAGVEKPITNGSAVSDPVTISSPAGVGQYCFRAEYNPAAGSKYLEASHTNSTTECFKVIPAQVTIIKTTSTGTVSAGQPISFTLSWGNSGAGKATGVVVSDNLPTTNGLSWTITGQTGTGSTCGIATNVLTCNVGDIPGNTPVSGTVTVTSQTTSANCGVIDNTGTITSANDGTADSSASVTVNCPDVTVVKTPDAGTVQAGDPAVFTIKVWNIGPGTATSVTLTDSLPAGYTWTLGGPDAGSCSINAVPDPDVLSCNFGDLAPGTIATAKTITLTAPTTGQDCAVIPNTAVVDATNEPNTTQYTANNTDSGSIDVLCGNVVIVKTADPAGPVSAGEEIGFDVTVTNNGDGEARGVTVDDPLPAGVAWSIDPESDGWSINAQNHLVFGPATLAAGASTTVHIEGLTDAADCGVVTNTATVATTNDGAGESTATVTVQCPNITVAKTAVPEGPVSAGEIIGFDVTISNAGPGTAFGAQASDTLPGSGWAIVGPANGWSLDGNSLTFGPADLAAGQSRTVHVERLSTPADCGTVPNTVTGFATNEPASSQPNTASDSVDVNCPNITVAKTAVPEGPVSAGEIIGFDVTISNAGPGTAFGAQASDTLPGSGWAIVGPANGWSLDGNSLTFGPADLAAGQSRTVHVERLSTPADCGTVPNTVTGFATNEPASSQPNTASDSVVVQCPDVTVSKTADVSPVSAGEVASFTITVWNLGPGTAFDVTLNDPLPAGVEWALDAPVEGCSIVDNVLSCTFDVLLPGIENAIEIHVAGETDFADCEGLPNTVTVGAGNEPAGNTENNEASASIDVDCPDVGIVKTADHQAPVSAGDEIGFTVTLANNGDGTAFDVSVDDVLPTGFGWTIESQSGGWSITPAGHLVWGPADLAAHSTATVHIVSDTSNEDCGLVPNEAAAFLDTQPVDDDSAAEEVDCPNVTVTKVADDEQVSAGDEIGFTVTIINEGPGTAYGAFASDPLPGSGWTIESQDGGWTLTDGVLTFAGDLAAGASSSVHVVRDTTAEDCGLVTNTVTVGAENEETEAGGDNTASDDVDVDCPNVTVTKVADDEQVSAGDEIGFTVTIINEGPGTAYGAFASDPLPGSGWTIESQDGGWTLTDGVLTFAGDLAAGASSSVHVVRDTTAEDCGLVTNTVTVGAENEDPEAGGDNTASDDVDVDCPNVTVTKVADDEQVSAGDEIGFTVTIINEGPGTAYGAFASDPLPGSGWTIESQDGGWTLTDGVLTFAGDLAAGASSSVHVVRDTTAEDCGLVTNTVTVGAENEDPEAGGDNTASDDVDVDCPDITVDKTADVSPINAGEVAAFTIEVWNGGQGTAYDVTLTDTLPSGVDWVVDATDPDGIECEIEGQTLTCDLGDLEPEGEGDTNHVFIYLSGETSVLDCGEGGFDLVNSVVVSASNEPEDDELPNEDEATVEVLCADLLIGKDADHAGPVQAGNPIGFTVTIANNGEGTAFDISVDDELPAGFDWTIESQSGGWTIVDGHLIWGPDDLAAESMSSVHIVADTDQEDCGLVPNQAFLSQDDQPVDDDSAAEEVDCPDIDIDKDTPTDVAGPGQTVHYTIGVYVDGEVAGGTVTDVLPDGQTYVTDSQTADPAASAFEVSPDGRTLTWTFDTTLSGDPAATIEYDVTIDDDAVAGSQTNEAELCVVIGPTGDGQGELALAAFDSPVNVADDLCDTDDETIRVPELLIAKSVAGNSGGETGEGTPIAIVGDTLTYTLEYTLENGPVTDGVITDVIPDGLEYVDGTASDNAEFSFVDYDEETRTLTWTAETVTDGGSLTYDVVVIDNAERDVDLINVATIDSNETQPDDDDQPVTVPPTPEYGLVIDKSNDAPIETIDLGDGTTVDLPTADEGDTVTFTLDYTMTGDPVTDGVLTDVLPEGLAYVDGTASSNDEFTFVAYDDENRTLTWEAETVTESGTLTYDALVEEGAAELEQPLVNVATIDSAETEPDSDDSSVFVPEEPEALTPPPTDTLDTPRVTGNPGFTLMLVLLALAGLALGLGFVTPVPERVRRRDRR